MGGLFAFVGAFIAIGSFGLVVISKTPIVTVVSAVAVLVGTVLFVGGCVLIAIQSAAADICARLPKPRAAEPPAKP